METAMPRSAWGASEFLFTRPDGQHPAVGFWLLLGLQPCQPRFKGFLSTSFHTLCSCSRAPRTSSVLAPSSLSAPTVMAQGDQARKHNGPDSWNSGMEHRSPSGYLSPLLPTFIGL